MEASPHRQSEPHPWELLTRDVIPRPLPTPIPDAPKLPFEFPEPHGVHDGSIPPARRILNHVIQPGPKNGWR